VRLRTAGVIEMNILGPPPTRASLERGPNTTLLRYLSGTRQCTCTDARQNDAHLVQQATLDDKASIRECCPSP